MKSGSVSHSVASDSLWPQRQSQARILEWFAISYSKGSSQPRDQFSISGIGWWSLYCLSHQGSIYYNIIQLQKKNGSWKEWNNAFCSNMHGPRDYHAKSDKNKWNDLYVESKKKKKDTNELVYKTEINSQTSKAN